MTSATHLHFDGYSGISGDMTLGALVDLGVPLADLQKGLSKLPIGIFALRVERVKRAGLMATLVHVDVEEERHVHRHLNDIYAIVDAAELPPRVTARARMAYRKIAEAEAQVHGSTPEKIHFHEVGAKDAIVDVAGAMLGVELLGAETFSASALTVGFGMVKCMHGLMPVPAPATALLLKGMPTARGPIEGEMVTPTGAAILGTLLDGEGGRGFIAGDSSRTQLISEKVGYGAGTRVYENYPNFLRLELCRAQEQAQAPRLPAALETIRVLECEIDDMTPEAAGWLLGRLLESGALDAHWQPVQMKKNRPGLRLRVLAKPEHEARLAELIFRETPTLGLRRSEQERWTLGRRSEKIETSLGPIAVKVALWGEEILKVSPEYDACAELARRHGMPLSEVMAEARVEIQRRYGKAAE